MYITLTIREIKKLSSRCRPAAGRASDAPAWALCRIVVRDGLMEVTTHRETLTAVASGAHAGPAEDVRGGSVFVPFAELAELSKLKGVNNTVTFQLEAGKLVWTYRVGDAVEADGTIEVEQSKEIFSTWLRVPSGGRPSPDARTLDTHAAAAVLGSSEDDLPLTDAVHLVGSNYIAGARLTYACAEVADEFSFEQTTAVPAAALKAALRAKGPVQVTSDSHVVRLYAQEGTYIAPKPDVQPMGRLSEILDAPTTPLGIATEKLLELCKTVKKEAKEAKLSATITLHAGQADAEVQVQEASRVPMGSPASVTVTFDPELLSPMLEGIDEPAVSVAESAPLLRVDGTAASARVCRLVSQILDAPQLQN